MKKQELIDLVDNGQAQVLTIESAKALRGKKIATICFGYADQTYTDEFYVGDLVSELEYYRTLEEDCFPDEFGNTNRAEYWESYMSAEELRRRKNKMLLLDDEDRKTYIFSDVADEYMWKSDEDRPVFYVEL